MSFLCLNPKPESPFTVHESPVTDQHESSVRRNWNEFPICTSAMCRSNYFVNYDRYHVNKIIH